MEPRPLDFESIEVIIDGKPFLMDVPKDRQASTAQTNTSLIGERESGVNAPPQSTEIIDPRITRKSRSWSLRNILGSAFFLTITSVSAYLCVGRFQAINKTNSDPKIQRLDKAISDNDLTVHYNQELLKIHNTNIEIQKAIDYHSHLKRIAEDDLMDYETRTYPFSRKANDLLAKMSLAGALAAGYLAVGSHLRKMISKINIHG